MIDPYLASVARARAEFVKASAGHEMTVLRDDELYRHLRFQKPGTSNYYFDLVTWPGYLAMVGDCGSYLFCRDRDMFEWFTGGARRSFDDERWGISPQNWAQKLQTPQSTGSSASEVFSVEVYKSHVRDWLAERESDILGEDNVERTGHGPAADVQAYIDHIENDFGERQLERVLELREAVEWSLLDSFEGPHTEEQAIRMLDEFEHNGIRFEEPWHLDMREMDHRFLFCCWAIVWGIEQYRAAACSNAPVGAGAVAEVSGV